jgi:hypothetical protein
MRCLTPYREAPAFVPGFSFQRTILAIHRLFVAKPTAEQERAIISALKSLGWSQGLDGMSISTVRATCPSLTSDEAAREVIRELFERGLIAQEMESGGTLDVRKNIPMAKCRWISK